MRKFFPLITCLTATTGLLVAQSSIFQVQPSPNPNPHGNAFLGMAATSPSDVWAVGFENANSSFNNGARTLIEHFDGSAWSVVTSPNPNPGHCSSAGFALMGAGASSSTDAWAVGTRNVNSTCTSLINPLIVHWDGSAWSLSPNPTLSPNGNNALNGVKAFAPDNAYAVGYQTGPRDATFTLVEHWDGTKWSVLKTPNGNSTGNVLSAISASSPSDIWAVGNKVAPNVAVQTLVLHFNGTAWKVVPSPNPVSGDLSQNVMLGVTAVAPNDVTAVGYLNNAAALNLTTLIEHWDGTSWKVIPSPNVSSAQGAVNVLTSVTALSSSNIYAFGYFSDAATQGQPQTLVEHFDGVSWTIVPSPTKRLATQLFAATALPESDEIWSAGAFSPNGIDPEFGNLQVPQTFVMFSSQP